MATIVLHLPNQIWKTGYIPSHRRKATVVSIHKKGDPADVDNCRGISLIPVPFKLFLSLNTVRVQKMMEKNRLFCREQAGFWSQEEYPGQVAGST